jgi:hypothetical protein
LALGPDLIATAIEADDRQLGGDGRAGHRATGWEVGGPLVAQPLPFGTDLMSDPLHLAAAEADLGLVDERLPGLLERTGPSRRPEDLPQARGREVVRAEP